MMKFIKLLIASASILLFLPLTATAQNTLYAVDGAGGGGGSGSGLPSSVLYQLDPSDGSLIATIGPIGFDHVTGIAISPLTGILYGVVSDIFDSGNSFLIIINRNTGAGTVVGSTDSQLPDISFDSNGTLYAWSEFISSDPNNNDDLWTINLTTGVPTKVGECGCDTFRTGLAFDSANNLYMKLDTDLNTMDAATGLITSTVTLNSNASNMLAFDSTDTLFTGDRINQNTQFELKTINPATGATTTVGINDIPSISAIAFDTGIKASVPVPASSLQSLLALILLLGLTGLFWQRKFS